VREVIPAADAQPALSQVCPSPVAIALFHLTGISHLKLRRRTSSAVLRKIPGFETSSKPFRVRGLQSLDDLDGTSLLSPRRTVPDPMRINAPVPGPFGMFCTLPVDHHEIASPAVGVGFLPGLTVRDCVKPHLRFRQFSRPVSWTFSAGGNRDFGMPNVLCRVNSLGTGGT
jgi:hypothetical protein